jgi:hypothetical protein
MVMQLQFSIGKTIQHCIFYFVSYRDEFGLFTDNSRRHVERRTELRARQLPGPGTESVGDPCCREQDEAD